MHKDEAPSIFTRYYTPAPFVDRYAANRERAVDVIIPVIHTNELWRANLLSIYREIPVRRLLLGDGGCIDDSLDVAREFPRVEVLDHRNFTSLGFSIRHLIEAVESEWFVYLHSDVYLPEGWFDAMDSHRGEYDWFECNQKITVLAEYLLDTTKLERAYSGSQMGRKAAFDQFLPQIDDDYLYRNEDIIFASLVNRAGLRYGKVGETAHFHQVMFKPSRWYRNIKRMDIEPELSCEEEIRANQTYVQGIIKYLQPADVPADVIPSLRSTLVRLIDLGETTLGDFRDWVRVTNAAWLPEFTYPRMSLRRYRNADRLVRLANVYRIHGIFGSVKRVLGYLLRRSGMSR